MSCLNMQKYVTEMVFEFPGETVNKEQRHADVPHLKREVVVIWDQIKIIFSVIIQHFQKG